MNTPSTILTLLLLATTTLAQTPVLVKDINPGAGDGFPNNKEYLVAIGNVVYFAGDDGAHGAELWRSDGTEAGTYMVKDIRPDSLGSAPIRFNVLGDHLLFIANDGTHGDELWSSDGTEAGTVLVKDINPGAGNVIRRNYIKQMRDRRVVNGILFFAADTGNGYSQLWRSDGTEPGTFLVSDVCPNCTATNLSSGEFALLNDKLYLVGGDNLWRSDGTSAGTQIAIDSLGGGVPKFLRQITGANGLLYMAGSNTANYDLWVSDGTESGTHLIKTFATAARPRQFTAFGDRVFFIVDSQLWSTDGTEAGTQLESSLLVDDVSRLTNNLFLWKEELYYRAEAADGQSYIYKTDGTTEEQVWSQNFQGATFADPIFYAPTEEFLYYDALSENPFTAGIGRINSTGTIKEIIPLPNVSFTEYLFVAGNNLFFRARSNAGSELWKLPLTTSAAPELASTLALRIYPTLSRDGIFHLDYPGAPVEIFEIKVFDGLGKLSYRATQSPDVPLRLSTLSAGTYFIHIATRSGQFMTQKVVIGQ